MEIRFIGAAHEVTGSCHFLSACGKNILVDYGMEQGKDIYENQPLPVNASDVDYVFLTHAHVDHSGLLPLLYSRGFRGSVFATEATADLCDIMLKDSAHIQMFEAEWRNRKGRRAGKEEVVPLYDMDDALGAIQLLVGCEYNKVIDICEGIRVRFIDIGHLLGSSSIEVWIDEAGVQKKIVFSGDIGNINQPLIKDPEYIKEADYVLIESTYGDRYHNLARVDYVKELAKIIKETFDKGGNLVIPSFAVGRTQEMLYFIRMIKEQNLVKEYADFQVYLDSPLAIEATNIFHDNSWDCFDEEAIDLLKQGINPIQFPGLNLSVTSEESKLINSDKKSKVIISASGMCEAGRIRHHLKHNLWRSECTILFVGYQAVGTLGRSLIDGVSSVKLFGETIEVNARIMKLDGLSGHADKAGLLCWLQSFEHKPKKVFVVHGEDKVCDNFAKCLRDEYGYDAKAPYTGAVYDLIKDVWVAEGVCVPKAEKTPAKRASEVFNRLVAAGQRLMTVIRKNEGGTNKDLAKFTDQIHSLCDKWDR